MRVLKAVLKVIGALVGVLIVAAVVFDWRESKRGEDWMSCSFQASDRQEAKDEELSREQRIARINLATDTCMERRGHDFIGGRYPADCGIERLSMCYSIF
jgi:hypothetical protein